MLTENEIARNWRNLFQKNAAEISEETLAKAESLLENLRAESPLRHRLGTELEELRKRLTQKASKR